jgi:ATP-dependent Clp protease adaptor protein ClpS
MSDEHKKEGAEQGDVATRRRKRVEKAKPYQVVLHNDNYTTMEFVVHVLMKFFHKEEPEATHIMLTVHHKGAGVAGVYSKDVAETKVHQVTSYAQESGYPLKTTAEPAS